MRIKNEEELANVLGRVFEGYANRVANGLVGPYTELLSKDSVDVVFTVTHEGIASIKPVKPEPATPLFTETATTYSKDEVATSIEPEPVIEEEKPKRKKKTAESTEEQTE